MFIAFLKFHVCYHDGVKCLTDSWHCAASILIISFLWEGVMWWAAIYHVTLITAVIVGYQCYNDTKQILILQLVYNLMLYQIAVTLLFYTVNFLATTAASIYAKHCT